MDDLIEAWHVAAAGLAWIIGQWYRVQGLKREYDRKLEAAITEREDVKHRLRTLEAEVQGQKDNWHQFREEMRGKFKDIFDEIRKNGNAISKLEGIIEGRAHNDAS